MTRRRRNKRALVGQCAICLTHGPLTDEDIYPQWLRRLSHDTGRSTVPLCSSCNGKLGAMSQEPASRIVKAIIGAAQGEVVVLSPDQQVVLAGWAAQVGYLSALRDASGIDSNLAVR